jgi:hypothetical protein
VIDSPYISRLHCRLERHYDCIRVEDHSKNGTWFDDRLIKERRTCGPAKHSQRQAALPRAK